MRVTGDGVELCVEADGPLDRTPVVFLHGVSGSMATYGWLPEPVTGGRRVIRLDLRGHGGSDRAPGTYDVGAYTADVITALRALTDRPAVLVGHSVGGVVAWTVAQRTPELVRAAFLEDPPLYMGEPTEHDRNPAIPVFRALRAACLSWRAAGLDAAAAASRLAASPIAATAAEGVLAARAQALMAMDPGVLDAAIDGSALTPTDTLAPVTVPTHLLAADEAFGSAFPVRHGRRLARTHPGVEVMRLHDVGHAIHDDRDGRPRYVECLTRFLAAY